MNGTLQAFVASDLAELIMENWRSCNTSYQNEFLSAESWPPSSEYERSTHLSVFREMLLAGATKVRQNYSRFWAYFFLFAHVVDLTWALAHGRKSTYIVLVISSSQPYWPGGMRGLTFLTLTHSL